jgi:hypothetical protein
MHPTTERVLEALAAWEKDLQKLDRRTSNFELFNAINKYNWSPEAVKGGGVTLVQTVWPVVYENNRSLAGDVKLEFSVLVGLLKNNIWRPIFEKPESARDFICFLLRYIERNKGPNTVTYAESVAMQLETAMAEWIAPGEVVTSYALRPIASALFGEPWCTFLLDSCAAGSSMSELIATTKPDFLPGRITTGPEQGNVDLPNLS